ncbi:MAG: dTDP-4-dehydrorhamnose reductase [Saprospiraceae bacterium]|nr:dTDP-4-dehydrorhamnose reductase [Saprospiraceae bacterium]
MKVLVTGAQGQLAQEIQHLASLYPEIKFEFFDKTEWDISDEKQTYKILSNAHADFVVNTAAYTKVDLAETNSEICNRINYEAPKMIAATCNGLKTRIIQISSDYVFFNSIHKALIETFPKNPNGVYATSKSKAEDVIMNYNPQNIIIRTSWLYSSFGHNFVKTMIRMANLGKPIQVVDDQIGSPTYAADLAEVIIKIILSPSKKIEGIYHYCNEGACSWYEFAQEIFSHLNLNVSLKAISTNEFGALAPRPAFSQLDCTKIKTELQIAIPSWKNSLHKCLDKITTTI